MAKIQVPCPNCKQPSVTEIEQLFDVAADPQAKQRLLNGSFNVINCPFCGFQGQVPTPLIYHDPSKEFLLTYFPAELNVPVMEQERSIAPLINKVVDNLPQEQRKGYLFNPQQMFTLQNLIEKVLEGEGITKEMLDAQRKRVDLLQRLMAASDDGLVGMVQAASETIDSEFFTLLSRMLEAGMAARDEASVSKLGRIQEALLEHTEMGRQIKSQADEVEAARQSLEAAGKELTREKLLDLLSEAAGNDIRFNALASMARPGLDYSFFQMLSERLDAADGADKDKLNKMREDLLEITKRVDEQLQARLNVALRNLDALLEAEDAAVLIQENPAVLDEFFIQVLNQSLGEAQQNNDSARLQKLQALTQVIQQLITPGYNPELLDKLMEAADEETLKKIVAEHKDEITPEFIESLSAMMMQLEATEDKELTEKIRAAYRAALRVSMEKGMQG
ncbi:MAG: hypothetical protein KIT46_07665 [Anaerolineales bacterium]|nr:hypothetical protein [Anaerolineales bacterium]MCW5855907.1 hypothetical protein [Anaerolineales bacterium]